MYTLIDLALSRRAGPRSRGVPLSVGRGRDRWDMGVGAHPHYLRIIVISILYMMRVDIAT